MRTLVEPAPWSRCDHCRGELRFKAVEATHMTPDLKHEIFVCAGCGREARFTVPHDPHAPHAWAA
jgi:uncharacterized protein with PIN domain